MCFYHVMDKIHEKLKSVLDRLSEQVMADIYDLHFAMTSAVYDERVKQVLTKWSVFSYAEWICYNEQPGRTVQQVDKA
ncbi:hypothetical protein PPTG_23054 [Phytophthora nicotianae INRA-310]|uniref:MULE transposase domain-containing protein n=1 Tax=Phytophthora nicotianae (strain INRA-310) TaxID=761204 RepID=W2Q639_PHYN3|nr:hypothetical protein PPTG_23054 [Phytophthora nicotianae INRA-310]ETN08622.1 hypothetical protein PPTG_23054 [Phytophthora nicotianae INRA-310]